MNDAAATRRLLVNGERLRVDVQATRSGGGTKYEPQTAQEAREALLPQLRETLRTFDDLDDRLKSPEAVYFEARLLPNYISASDFPQSLLDQVGAVAVGSRADRALYRTSKSAREAGTRRLILAVDETGLERFEDLMSSGGDSTSSRQAFQEVRKLDQLALGTPWVAPERIGIASDEPMLWEAVLNPGGARGGECLPAGDVTRDLWFELIASRGGSVETDYVRVSGGLTFCPVRLARSELGYVARFNPLRAMRPMPAIRPRPRFGSRGIARALPPAQTTPLFDEPSVAVFDGGFEAPSAVLHPRAAVDLTTEPIDADDLIHGTGVVGITLSGLAQQGQPVEQPLLPVDCYRVLPAPFVPGDLDGYWVLDRIKESVVDGGYKIVNLSLGPDLPVEDTTEPNRWTSELDQLAWEHDVLFVIASGNDGDQDQATGLHRVQVPADMANGLAVGACDVHEPTVPWGRAPYSSMGPGRAGNRVAPTGVQFGGVDNNPFPLIQSDGAFVDACGTSFAAPLHTHALMDLSTRLPRLNASVLRAFSVHFADRHRRHRQLIDEVGYGRLPSSFADRLDCSADEVHVLFVDEIARGELLGYQLPTPTGVGAADVQFTLAYASPVEPTQPTEYTRAALEMAFRPHHRKYRIRPPKGAKGRAVVLDYTSADARKLFALGWEMGQEPVTQGLGAAGRTPEYQLRDGGKWETIRHARVNLASDALEEPRFEISYVARRAGALDNSPTKVPFALLVSVRDPSASGTFYDDVSKRFPALRAVAQNRNQVRVRARGRWA